MQNDMLKEFIAQKEWISPPSPPSASLVDTIEFCARHVPKFNPVSSRLSHPEAGSTAVQEARLHLADGFGYVRPAWSGGSTWTISRRVFVLSRHPQRFFERCQAAERPDASGPP